MKPKFTILSLLIILLININLHAESDTLKHFPAQISFVYPIGTSGIESANYEFGLSLNALLGVTGGIKGLECAGIMNTVRNNVLGLQCAGIMNTVNGHFHGYQAAGIMNITNKDFKGVQNGGIVNIVNDSLVGIQAAGISNIANNSLQGIQIAGIANILNGNSIGIQASGIANILNGNFKGIQVAGIANILNGNSKGIQTAGIINISTGEHKGLQVAGIINRTQKLYGAQIGLINICDTLEKGIPIGLINIVGEGGFHEWELSVADYANARISYKSGVNAFYTIYTIGMNYLEDKLFIAGIGCGQVYEVSPKFNIQPELLTIGYNNRFMDRHDYSGSTHLKIGFTFLFTKGFGVSLAPSIYANVSGNDYPYYTNHKISPFKPFRTYTNNDVRVDIGAGLSFAILFR